MFKAIKTFLSSHIREGRYPPTPWPPPPETTRLSDLDVYSNGKPSMPANPSLPLSPRTHNEAEEPLPEIPARPFLPSSTLVSADPLKKMSPTVPVTKHGGNYSDNYIQVSFERFHADNPKVYKKLVEFALAAKANGHQQIGIGLLWERLRWFYTMETTGETYKLNNNHRSRYARLIMNSVPTLDGFFKTRELY